MVVRVRCQGLWHDVRPCPDGPPVPHDPREPMRERALRALGGRVSGCGAAEDAWRNGLPRLLAAGLAAGDIDRHGRTPLHEAVKHQDAELVRALIGMGADPYRTDADGRFRARLAQWVS
jgi:hypothetical protein